MICAAIPVESRPKTRNLTSQNTFLDVCGRICRSARCAALRGRRAGQLTTTQKRKSGAWSTGLELAAVGSGTQWLPFPLATLRNSEGVMLVCFLKTRLNEDFELKPTSSAMASTE